MKYSKLNIHIALCCISIKDTKNVTENKKFNNDVASNVNTALAKNISNPLMKDFTLFVFKRLERKYARHYWLVLLVATRITALHFRELTYVLYN
jgi:hypothetical protein